jgi:hypothetical protein
MKDIFDSRSSAWRAFHKSMVAAAQPLERKSDKTPGAGSWLGRARRGPGKSHEGGFRQGSLEQLRIVLQSSH